MCRGPHQPLRARVRVAVSHRRDLLPNPQRDPARAGLGSSAAAIVAGLLAADHLYEFAQEPEDVLAKAAELEGHPDNVAAALYGGFVVCGRGKRQGDLERLDPPQGVEAVVVIPRSRCRPSEAREAISDQIPLADAVANISAAAELILGIQRSDLTLIGRGAPPTACTSPTGAHLYPRSMEIVGRRRGWGRSGRRSPAPARRGSSGPSGRAPGGDEGADASGSGTGPRSAGYRSRRWARTCRSCDGRAARSRCGRRTRSSRSPPRAPLLSIGSVGSFASVGSIGRRRVGVLGRLRRPRPGR